MVKFKANNRGSGIVTVIITVAFIAMLGAILLFMAYMNMQIKNADRLTRNNFYYTETALNEVRAALQHSVSDAIASSYTSTLIMYGETLTDEDSDPQETFAEHFIASVAPTFGFSFTTGSFTATDISAGFKSIPYNSDILKGNITRFISPVYKVAAGGNAIVRFDMNGAPIALDIEGISVEYADAKGFQNTIYSDFSIGIPPFTAMSAGFRSRLNRYIIVADGTLNAGGSGSPREVDLVGNVYAGNVKVSGSGYTLNLNSGRVISAGEYSISGGATLNIKENASIWANRIKLENNASANLRGNIYIADDLELKGPNASATITGSYFGFGSSSVDGSKSSAILIGGSGSRLDFSALKTLVLAGRSFVSTDPVGSNHTLDIPMSGSLSITSDQIAYLVPDELIERREGSVYSKISNPNIWSSTVPTAYIYDSSSPAADRYTRIGTADTMASPPGTGYITISMTPELKAYGASIVQRIWPISSTGGNAVYYFLTFDTPANRDRYFKDYYTDNETKVNEYLRLYFDQSANTGLINSSGSVNSSGYIYEYVQTADGYELRPGTADSAPINSMSATYEQQYANLKSTLFESESGINTTPFTHFVDAAAITSDFSGSALTEFTDADGRVRALIIPEGYFNGSVTVFNLNGYYPDVNVIIACGTDANVTIGRSFKGLVISQGSVTLSEDLLNPGGSEMIDGNDGTTYEAFNASAPNGKLLLEYMSGSSRDRDPSLGGGAINWDLNNLVSYRNWSKNEKR